MNESAGLFGEGPQGLKPMEPITQSIGYKSQRQLIRF